MFLEKKEKVLEDFLTTMIKMKMMEELLTVRFGD